MAQRSTDRLKLPLLKGKPPVLAANCRPPSRSKGLTPSLTVDLTIRDRAGKSTGRSTSSDGGISFTTLMREMMLKLQTAEKGQEAEERKAERLEIKAVSMRRVRRKSKVVVSATCPQTSRPASAWLPTRHFDPISAFQPLAVKTSQVTQTQSPLPLQSVLKD